MADPERKPRSPDEVFREEAEAERHLAKMLADSTESLQNRCPECGALGSLEEVDGALRCIDCDLTVAATSRIGGFGRR